MQAIVPENLKWEQDGDCFRALLGEHDAVRLEMLEVPAGGVLPPHLHKEQHVYMCVVRSGGAVMHLGGRLFRPLAGQSFHVEPNDVAAIHNDTPHPLRILITRVGPLSDRVAVETPLEELMKPHHQVPASSAPS